ncbi:MAG: hypothetical protein HUU29_13815 [Planctomycetaceae bacterium]|nr:hypothetical protein [Planctomycetaceae bacterium]
MLRNLLIAAALILVATPALAEEGKERKCGCHRKGGQIFEKLDKSNDGVLTKDEAPKIVEHADSNGDGQVTKDEAKEAVKKHMKRKHSEPKKKQA